jgi:plasmid stabilization system protein ParE
VSLPLLITEEAEGDLAVAAAWYDQQRERLGREFVISVEQTLERIQQIPNGGAEVHPGIRRTRVRRFPYGILYRVDSDQIAIIAVYHGRRNPKGWQTRVQE